MRINEDTIQYITPLHVNHQNFLTLFEAYLSFNSALVYYIGKSKQLLTNDFTADQLYQPFEKRLSSCKRLLAEEIAHHFELCVENSTRRRMAGKPSPTSVRTLY